MLRTNLASRPFYNERLVHIVVGVALALVAAVTVYNVTHLVSLSRRLAEQSSAAGRDEARAADLRNRAAAIRRTIDPAALERVTIAAVEANALIDARAFSWTALFNDIEATLPPSVMLTAVTPSVEVSTSARSNVKTRQMLVRFVVLARGVEGVDTFIERLEETGRFRHVLAPTESITDEGLIQTTIEGYYDQAPPPAPKANAATTGRSAAAGGAR